MSWTPNVQIPRTFSYGTPAEVVFGNGTSQQTAGYVSALGAKNVLFVADKGVLSAGLAERVQKSLGASGIAWETFDGVTGEPTDVSVQAAVDLARAYTPDAIVAMGGGSAMDTAKATAVVAANGGTVLEHMNRQRQATRAGVPVVAITTTSGTGAEVTPASVITDVERKWKGGLGGPLVMPRLAICDPELTLGLPPMVTANTGIDALCHCLECYANAIFHPYAKLMALEGVRVVGRSLRKAVAHGGDLATRWQMMWGAHLGGLCIAKGVHGDAHGFAGPVCAMFDVPHGRGLAILLPHIMEFSLPGAVEAYADVAEALGEPVAGLSRVAAAERGVVAVRNLIADCGGPTRLSEVGVREEHIPALTKDAYARGNRAINPRIATPKDVEAILRAAL